MQDLTSEMVRKLIVEICDMIKDLLLKKNEAYGNSALDPIRIFSKSSPVEQLFVRIDDKLSRLMRGEKVDLVPEDTFIDLVGYIVLLIIAKRLGL